MLNDAVRRTLEERRSRLRSVEASLQDPAVFADPAKIRTLNRERGPLVKLTTRYEEFLRCERELAGCRELEKDPDMGAEARTEAAALEEKMKATGRWLEDELLQSDEDSARDVVIEIRAGTGGEEASLFAADLYRMYSRYAANKGWKVELMSSSPSESGGIKDVTISVVGEEVYRRLRFESGGHRVQRVPKTETQGRIHTSMVTVAVMPQAEEVDIKINPQDLRIDVMRSGGPGGQSVNTTDSAVRIVHIPTGLSVHCQQEKSQIKNRATAMKLLLSRLYAAEQERKKAEHDKFRRDQIGSGDRSERIRTYNFPQGRLTDHRLADNLYNIDVLMEGALDPLMDLLQAWDREQKLAQLG